MSRKYEPSSESQVVLCGECVREPLLVRDTQGPFDTRHLTLYVPQNATPDALHHRESDT